MPGVVYLNGEFLPRERATLSVDDRGFIFGDGIYEVTRVVNGRLFEADRHMRRLDYGLRGIGITPGGLYSPSGRYTRHLRLSGCYPFTERHLHALATLGELATAQLAAA